MGRIPAEPSNAGNSRAVNLRVREDVRALIDRAAQAMGRSRSDFMIEASRRAAEDAIIDQTIIMTNRENYDRFLALLDRPAEPNARLRKLMQTPAPWEER